MTQRENLILTLQPNGKKGIIISKEHYELLCSYILFTVEQRENVKLCELIENIPGNLSEVIAKDIPWYILQVKLDLEAKGLIAMKLRHYKGRTSFIKLTKQGIKLARQKHAGTSVINNSITQ